MLSNAAIIVGDRGQDGSLLRASLERQGIQVVGVGREQLSLPQYISGVSQAGFSIANTEQVAALVEATRPSEVYYLAAHHVSSEESGADNSPSEYDAYHRVHVVGLLNFLWAIRNHSPLCRLFYAGSSLVFNGSHGPIQTEETPFSPVGFYGLTKAQGIYICREFRRRHGIFASVGILYNHESALRPLKFLSKKLISSAHQISLGLQKDLSVGNLGAEADWGYAPDFVEAFQKVLRIEAADDFVIATGESHSVSEFAQIVFNHYGLEPTSYIRESPTALLRHLPRKVGDSSKLRQATGWKPRFDFQEMVKTLISDYMMNLNAQHVDEKSFIAPNH
jgi:GDPmannose 4,6-dehydratase